MDREAWWAAVYVVTKSWARLSNEHLLRGTHSHMLGFLIPFLT